MHKRLERLYVYAERLRKNPVSTENEADFCRSEGMSWWGAIVRSQPVRQGSQLQPGTAPSKGEFLASFYDLKGNDDPP